MVKEEDLVMCQEAPRLIASMEVAVIVEVELDLIPPVRQLVITVPERYVFQVSAAADLENPISL